MLKGIVDFITPKGELKGPVFLLNYIIIRLIGAIVSYIGLLITFSEYKDIPAIKFLTYVLFFTSLLMITVLAFNYKRRILNITKNLPLSIVFSIIFTFILEIVIAIFFANIYIFLINILFLPLIVAILPPADCNKLQYWKDFGLKLINFFRKPIVIFVIFMSIVDFGLVKLSIYKNHVISLKVPNEKFEKLTINPLTSFTGKTKAEILKLRENYVKSSVFYDDKYKPSEDVFGKIADNKPWWGIDYITCTDKSIPINKIKEGNSEESRFINNPNILIGVQLSKSYIKNEHNSFLCDDKSLLFIPETAYYSQKDKMIIVKYNPSDNILKHINNMYYIKLLLIGLNARDFGYNWIYVSNSNNLSFLPETIDSVMVNQKPQKIFDHIHLGTACQIEEGCNNASPFQPALSLK